MCSRYINGLSDKIWLARQNIKNVPQNGAPKLAKFKKIVKIFILTSLWRHRRYDQNFFANERSLLMLTSGENFKSISFTVQKLWIPPQNGHFTPFLPKIANFRPLIGHNFLKNCRRNMFDPSLDRYYWVLHDAIQINI